MGYGLLRSLVYSPCPFRRGPDSATAAYPPWGAREAAGEYMSLITLGRRLVLTANRESLPPPAPEWCFMPCCSLSNAD
jgi:hypothetical protein